MDIVLIAGLWLDATVWDEVVRSLEGRGHRGVPVQLPSQGDGTSSATLADQTTAVLEAIDTARGRSMVVGHSAASSLAWLAADARPDQIEKVMFVGGFPSPDGTPYADVFPVYEGLMPFPGWEPFAGPDSADLDDATKRALAAAAIPVPEGVCRGVVRLVDQRRYNVPVVLVCPEFSPAQAQECISGGRGTRTREGPAPLVPRHRLRALAHDQRTSRAGPTPGRRGRPGVTQSQAQSTETTMSYTVRSLDASTWDDFADLVERNNGIFGGCWRIGYHPECGQKGVSYRAVKEDRVRTGRAHAALVFDDDGAALTMASQWIAVVEKQQERRIACVGQHQGDLRAAHDHALSAVVD